MLKDQFLDTALIVANPDDPERPINSPKTVYQIEERLLELLLMEPHNGVKVSPHILLRLKL